MNSNPIYKYKNSETEDINYALNIYTACTNGCHGCCDTRVLDETHTEIERIKPYDGLIERLQKQLVREDYKNKTIHLCLTGDPYSSRIDTQATREVIKILKNAGCHIQIMTKNPGKSARDWGLLDSDDWIGTIFTGSDPWNARDPHLEPYLRIEPYTENEETRYRALGDAKSAGLHTCAYIGLPNDQEAIDYLMKLDRDRNAIDLVLFEEPDWPDWLADDE